MTPGLQIIYYCKLTKLAKCLLLSPWGRIDSATHHTNKWPLYHSKEGSVLLNDTLNTLYLRLYGVRHMVKDHSNSERINPLPPHGLLFPISSKGSFICTIPDKIAHTRPLLNQSWSTG